MLSCRLYKNLGQIDQNLSSQVFDDVICKPPISEKQSNFEVEQPSLKSSLYLNIS